MFVPFFYALRDKGVPVTPTAFLKLQKALSLGLIGSLHDFYVAARALMVKSERYFDLYDQVFAKYFYNIDYGDELEKDLEGALRVLLEDWLKDPRSLSEILGIDPDSLPALSPEELVRYFLDRLREQTERHDGGERWIGTGGTSPVGHSGFHPGGMRVGGRAGAGTAIKIALERRYRDYTQDSLLSASQVGEALRRLRCLVPAGPHDRVDIEKTIRETVRNAGEIEIVFSQSLRDRLKVILMIDNGGWSMDPYVDVVQTLFNYAHAQFKDIKVFYFHNCIYDRVWEDPRRIAKPFATADFVRFDPLSRLIIVGDASMAPMELEHPQGCIYYHERQSRPAIDQLRFLARLFRHSAWLNPMVQFGPDFSRGPYTTRTIAQIFPMFSLSLEGLERAVTHLVRRH
jgi:uncharacterized protein with von Willebrand factor type A (vWA) domain